MRWGWPVLAVLVALLGYRLARGWRPSPRVWPVAAAAAVFWLLAAANYIPSREAYSSRYMYAGSVFALLIAADLLRGVRFGRTALIVGGAVTVAAVAANQAPLVDGKAWLYEQTVLTRSDLGAIEIARRTIEPTFVLTPEVAGTGSLIDVEAANYLSIAREDGSPAYSPRELAVAPAAGRRQADIVLSQALPLSTHTLIGTDSRASGHCRVVTGGGGAHPAEVRLVPGITGIEAAPGGHASFGLRRFASGEYPVLTEGAPGNSTTLLHIPRDRAAQPWYLRVEAAQPVRVCG